MRLLRVLLPLLLLASAARADRLALWNLVHGQCVVHALAGAGPAPCQSVNLDDGEAAGSAVLKDLVGATQFLLIPTARVSGIEDPALRAPAGPNYFALGWRSIGLVGARAGADLPRDDLSLAVNAAAARSQDQLHIHMDCVRPDVKSALARLAPAIGPDWAPLPEPLLGRRWRALRLDGATPGRPTPSACSPPPFPPPTCGPTRWCWSASPSPAGCAGFVLLDGAVDLLAGDLGSGEDLQDHDCALARH